MTFWLVNDREHSTTKVTSFRAIMNYELKIWFRRYREHLKKDIRRRYYRRFFFRKTV